MPPKAMVECGICQQKEPKYKCPKCGIQYCGLQCFKSESHRHDSVPQKQPKKTVELDLDKLPDYSKRILEKSSRLQELLKIPQLQLQLLILDKIMKDPVVSGESSEEARLEVALKKLEMLRAGGLEENDLVEEFAMAFESVLEQPKEGGI